MKTLWIALLVLCATSGWAEWQVEYDPSFVALMRRIGHPIPARTGSFATREECLEAIRRAEAGDPSLVGKMWPVQVGGGGASGSSGSRPPAQPARNLRQEEAEYQAMVTRHQQLVREVERAEAEKYAAFIAERDRLTATLKESAKPVLEFKNSSKPPPSSLPALKQLESATMLSLLADRAGLPSNNALARELSEIATHLRVTFDETLRQKVPDVPAPTPVQQQFFEYVAQQSKSVSAAIQQFQKRLTQAAEKHEQVEQQVTDLTAKVEQLRHPPAEAPKPSETDKLLAEAQALLAQAQSDKQAVEAELNALQATTEVEYCKLQLLDQALETVSKQPDRAEEMLKQLQEAKP